MRAAIFLIITTILFSLVSASISFDASVLEFNISKGEKLCRNVNIVSDFNGTVYVRTQWSTEDTVSLASHNLTEDDIGLKLQYNSMVILEENKPYKFRICIYNSDGNYYHGALIFREPIKEIVQNAPNIGKEYGIWLVVNPGEKSSNAVINDSMITQDTQISDGSICFTAVIILFMAMVVLFLINLASELYRRRLKQKEKGVDECEELGDL